jgi:hypothetical protein
LALFYSVHGIAQGRHPRNIGGEISPNFSTARVSLVTNHIPSSLRNIVVALNIYVLSYVMDRTIVNGEGRGAFVHNFHWGKIMPLPEVL